MTGRRLLLTALLLLPSTARARLEFAGDAPRILTVEPRAHSFYHEVYLGAGILPIDAFYVGVAATASYAYHFTDIIAWELLQGFYSYNVNTGLQNDLASFHAPPANLNDLVQNKMGLTTNVVFTPMSGKFAIFNRSILQAETFVVAGIGAVLTTKDWRPTLDLGAGLRLWAARSVSIRLDARDYLVFDGVVPNGALFIFLSGSWGFGAANQISAAEGGAG